MLSVVHSSVESGAEIDVEDQREHDGDEIGEVEMAMSDSTLRIAKTDRFDQELD